MPKHRHIALVSFDGGNASTITAPLELLEFARAKVAETTPLTLSLVSKDGTAVTCGGCVTITPADSIEHVADADLVFLAGMPCNVDEVITGNGSVLGWLREQRARGTEIATVCPTQALLAHGGLLDGRSVAMHWSLIEEVRARWPHTHWTADRMVIEDHGIFSCCGASATVDLTLYIIGRYCGRDAMLECAQWFLTDLPRVRQQLPPPLLNAPAASQPLMAEVESWILGHFHEPVHFETLAREFGMSWRTFYRRFQETFGDSPKVYLQKLRLNAARRLLENDGDPIDRIAAKVGYADAGFFRTLFKRHVGMTPSRYRESFRFRALPAD